MKYMRIFIVLMLVFSSAACSLTKQQDKPAWGGSEEWRMKSLEESFLNFKEGMSEQKDALQNLSTNIDKRFDSIDNRLNDFENRLAELDQMQKKLMVASTTETVPDETVVGGSASGEERPWMNVPGEDEKKSGNEANNETAPKSIAAVAPAPVKMSTPAPASSAPSAEDVYNEGVRQVLNGHPEESRTILTKFLQTYPTNKLAPNALYWLGETFYSQKRFAESILKFREVGQRFPKASKVPDSLLKIGLAYEKLGDKQNSVFYLKTLIENYPKSDPAKIGRSRLKQIGG